MTNQLKDIRIFTDPLDERGRVIMGFQSKVRPNAVTNTPIDVTDMVLGAVADMLTNAGQWEAGEYWITPLGDDATLIAGRAIRITAEYATQEMIDEKKANDNEQNNEQGQD